jgi:hypothetical protein
LVLSEILLAGAIITFALASVIIVIGSLQSMSITLQNSFAASLVAQQELAMLRLRDFDELLSFQKNDEYFDTNIVVSYRNYFSADVVVDVSWSENSVEKHYALNDQIVDWKNAGGKLDCDWLDEAEGKLSSLDFDALFIDEGNLVTDAVALGDFVYVSTDSATSSLPDLYVVNAADIHHPQIISKLNTGPGIAAISAVNNYIFVANAGSYQMQIIDVTDPVLPRLVSQAKMPGAVVQGSEGFGHSIDFFDDKVYLGLTKNSGPEFFVVDVINRNTPIFLDSFEVNGAVNGISARKNFVVLGNAGQNSLYLLDNTNPQSISEIARTTLTGWQTQSVESIEILGQQIYVGRSLGGFYSPNPDLVALNRAHLATGITSTTSLKINSTIEDILAFNNFLYIATNDLNKTFQILETPSFHASNTFSLPSRAMAVTCNNNAMFVVSENNQDFFHIFYLPK